MTTTTGTESSDTLRNAPGDRNHVIDALGGDDVIQVFSVFSGDTTGTGSRVRVNGGDGYDTLIIDDRITGVSGSGFSGSVSTRPVGGAIWITDITWTSIEQLNLTFSTYYYNGWLTTGDSGDVLTMLGGVNFNTIVGSALLGTQGGDDYIVVRGDYQTMQISAGDGFDVIDISQVGRIVDNRRDLYGDGGDDVLIGSDLADYLSGGTGNDRLEGRDGIDIMYGGAGDDIYFVDNLGDAIGEYADEGVDEVRTALTSYGLQDFAQVENLTFLGGGTNNGAGNDRANTITGNVDVDILYGRGGDDIFMLQLGGADQAFGESGSDRFYFGAALTQADRIEGGSETDLVVIQGDYAGQNALRLGGLAGIEQLHLLSGADNSYGFGSETLYAYDLTAEEGTLSSGQILYVLSQKLGAG